MLIFFQYLLKKVDSITVLFLFEVTLSWLDLLVPFEFILLKILQFDVLWKFFHSFRQNIMHHFSLIEVFLSESMQIVKQVFLVEFEIIFIEFENLFGLLVVF